MPPFHDLLNDGLLEVTHKLHVHLKAQVIRMKLAIPKVPREISAERNGGRLEQPSLSCSHILKKEREREREHVIFFFFLKDER